MRVLVLSKRQYMSRDLLDDRYGRFRELPLGLASRGHEVDGMCLSYRSRNEVECTDVVNGSTVRWKSVNAVKVLVSGGSGYWKALEKFLDGRRPDLVWACSDVPHAILGVRAARRLGAKVIIDLYDNFESYTLTRLPGMGLALRRAVRAADGITCVSEPLAGLVADRYGYAGPVEVIENAVPGDSFRPMERERARVLLNLPRHAVLVGTAGSLSRSRGIDVLFAAFRTLSNERPDVHLVLAGPVDRGVKLPQGKRVHYLGFVPPDRVPLVLNALDVSVICNRESAFGSYCFPQKFHESVACGVPVLAASVGAMRGVLKDYPGNLFESGNAQNLVRKLREQLARPTPLPVLAPTWDDLGRRLSRFIDRVGGYA
jgi:teichuronic acid biosynthesis glycosyltransferase TuaC